MKNGPKRRILFHVGTFVKDFFGLRGPGTVFPEGLVPAFVDDEGFVPASRGSLVNSL